LISRIDRGQPFASSRSPVFLFAFLKRLVNYGVVTSIYEFEILASPTLEESGGDEYLLFSE
jgi:hypothetical protein